jgi:hypothetical protein
MVDELRAQLLIWMDQKQRLSSLISKSALLSELGPVPNAIGSLGANGYTALDALVKGERMSEEDKARAYEVIDFLTIQVRQAQLELSITPAVKQLIAAAATAGVCTK